MAWMINVETSNPTTSYTIRSDSRQDISCMTGGVFLKSSQIERLSKGCVSTRVAEKKLRPFLGGGRPAFVNDTIKGFIEEIEPSVHQFVGMRLQRHSDYEKGSDQFYDKIYWGLNVHRHLRSLNPSKSNMRWRKSNVVDEKSGLVLASRDYDLAESARRGMRQHVIEGAEAHLWRENSLHGYLFCSDAFREGFKKLKIRGFSFWPCQEYDIEENLKKRSADGEARHISTVELT